MNNFYFDCTTRKENVETSKNMKLYILFPDKNFSTNERIQVNNYNLLGGLRNQNQLFIHKAFNDKAKILPPIMLSSISRRYIWLHSMLEFKFANCIMHIRQTSSLVASICSASHPLNMNSE
jgi:hypothetical protein